MYSYDPTVVQVSAGGIAVSGEKDYVMTTVVGSAVALCLWDRNLHFGGMTQFWSPGRRQCEAVEGGLGVQLLLSLIEEMQEFGANRRYMMAKLFGGASFSDADLHLGPANCEFVKSFVEDQEIPIRTQNLGGTNARRVEFYPASGAARVHLAGRDALERYRDGQLANGTGANFRDFGGTGLVGGGDN